MDCINIGVVNHLLKATSVHWNGLDVPNGMDGVLQEFTVTWLCMGEITPGIYDLDPMSHDFNFFTMNGRCFPYVTPLQVKAGEKVRIRLGNFGHDAHPIHIHGHQFAISGSDGNTIPVQNRLIKNTINIASGETFDVEFMADNPGN